MNPLPYQAYRQVAAQTASPGRLVLMLFDGAISFLDRALKGFESDDPLQFNQTINNNVLRAQAILRELKNSLNLEIGGELATKLDSLYDYMDNRLEDSNLHKKSDGIEETIRRLTLLRDAWKEMLQQQESAAAIPA